MSKRAELRHLYCELHTMLRESLIAALRIHA
jgi:hypothetical protein